VRALRASFRRPCRISEHKRLVFLGDYGYLFDIYLCLDCNGIRVKRRHAQSPMVESLEKVAHAIYTLAPKLKPDEVPKEVPLPSDIVAFCRKEWGMDKDTVERCLDILLDLGERLTTSVDGVPHRIRVGMGVGTRRGFEGIIRVMDEAGDPPFVRAVFNCPGCGKEYYADDMVDGELYFCEECFTWLAYEGFDVKSVTPWGCYSHVVVQVVEKATRNPISNLRLAIRKKVAVTDGGGYARFDYIPYGNYEISFLIGAREFKVPSSLKEGQGSALVRVSVAECGECRHLWVETDEASDQYRCPRCGTLHLRRDEKVYRLKQDEAFCYDFRGGWVWYWKLTCPSCGSPADLEFSSGRWLCPKCGYVEPKHSYGSFRCVLPCGHEHIYSIHYLTADVPLKCRTCGMEVKLPDRVRLAWSRVNDRGSWVALAAIGLGLFLGGLALGGRRR
jgi:predicted RNA-binding Zn-ribbon protein involved in translation (DUF1610 family)